MSRIINQPVLILNFILKPLYSSASPMTLFRDYLNSFHMTEKEIVIYHEIMFTLDDDKCIDKHIESMKNLARTLKPSVLFVFTRIIFINLHRSAMTSMQLSCHFGPIPTMKRVICLFVWNIRLQLCKWVALTIIFDIFSSYLHSSSPWSFLLPLETSSLTTKHTVSCCHAVALFGIRFHSMNSRRQL